MKLGGVPGGSGLSLDLGFGLDSGFAGSSEADADPAEAVGVKLDLLRRLGPTPGPEAGLKAGLEAELAAPPLPKSTAPCRPLGCCVDEGAGELELWGAGAAGLLRLRPCAHPCLRGGAGFEEG